MSEHIFFSCKANKNDGFISYAVDNNCGIEVSSIYELNAATKYNARKIIASGPAKNKKYLLTAINNDCIISVDDISELILLKTIVTKKEVKILIRIADITDTQSRFGIESFNIGNCLDIIRNSKIALIGFSFHLNNYNIDDRIAGIIKIFDIVEKQDIKINYIDIGGGFPVSYCNENEWNEFLNKNNKKMYFANKNIKTFYPYFSKIASENCLDYILTKMEGDLKKRNIDIIIEPGRSLLDQCGITIFKIEYLKQMVRENIIITNGNINFLSEQWFDSDFLIEPVHIPMNRQQKLEKPIYCSIAGNLCLEQDMMTWRKIKFDYLPMNGDFLIYLNTAGYQMDSNESSFHRIPLVKKVSEKEVFKNDL
jgi:diaminopimelate decarboxylase